MDLSRLSNEYDKKKCECRIVVETPKGRRNKFDYNPKLEAFTLGGLLAEGLSFPFDFGFIPSTLGEDGDSLDVMILMDEPAHVGCVLQVRLVGVIEAEQSENGKKISNNRLIGIAVHSYNHEHIRSISEINESIIDQVGEFFVSYNKSRGKKFMVTGIHGPSKALKLVDQGIKRFKKQ
jgi:inorganic pyrophosphatase